MRYLPVLLLTFLFCLEASQLKASDRDFGYPELPSPSCFYPDTNFTLMSHGFPTSPREQILINGHLYVSMGAYIVIYEVLPNGRLEETCSKMTNQVIRCMDHDGSYLYLSGVKGLQIYEGTNYTNPQLIGSNPLRITEIIYSMTVYGDSLYYSWDDSAWAGPWFGIIDIHDRSNPQIDTEFEDQIWTSGADKPIGYNRYIIVSTYLNSSHVVFGIYDLDSPPGTLVMVDSLRAFFNDMRLYENRLYSLRYNEVYIYEFTECTQPEYRSEIPVDNGIEDLSEVILNGDRFLYVATSYAHIYKINVNDLTNPVIVDSLIVPENLNHNFRDIEQSGNYSYAMTTRLNYYVQHPGVHVIDWTMPGGPELVQTAKKYSYCNTVKVINDAAYAETDNDGILVIDLTDKSNPQVVDPGYTIWGRYVKGDSNTLYTQNGNAVMFYDLGDPLAPALDWICLVPLDPGRYLFDYEVYDTLLIAYYYIGSLGGGGAAKILDISDRDDVRVLSTIPVESHIQPMCLDYPLLYLPTNEHWYTEIYDISDPANPVHIGTLQNSTGGISGVYTYENYVYVTGGVNRVYHWNQWNQIIFDRILDARPEYMVAEGGRIFYWGVRELHGISGVQVWDAWQDPVNPVFSGYHFDGTLSAWRKIDVEYPYAYIPGGDKGLVVLRYDSPTSIAEEQDNLPDEHGICITNYPNPFNSSTAIRYFLSEPGYVRIDIYDLLGRKVETLVDEEKQAGDYTVIFNASDLSSGVYFSRIQAGDDIQTRQMVLLK